jgi:hypothetical protein
MLDEGEQIALIEEYHRRAKIDLPRATLHAVIHTIGRTSTRRRIAGHCECDGTTRPYVEAIAEGNAQPCNSGRHGTGIGESHGISRYNW